MFQPFWLLPLIQDLWGGGSALIPHAHPPEGLFNIIGMICLHVVPVCPAKWGGTSSQFSDPGLVYDNYCKDTRSWQYYGCSYEDYMLAIIDTIIDAVEQPPSERDPLGLELEGLSGSKQSCLNQSSDMVVPNSKHMCDDLSLALQSRGQLFDDLSSQNRDTPSLIRDFNYPNKTVGYLAQESTDYEFIGSDRHPVAITTLPQLLEIADIISSTGYPNYKVARIPILSGLNVKAWELYLQDYSDKRVLQYIKFGFPLSLIGASELGNKEITNHYSACQYPEEIQKYIDKVNSYVNKSKFDESAFVLKFPNIDHITEDIVNCMEECALFKIDIARAFRNLRVDPCDSLKLGIHWKGWTHGSGAFQFLSDSIAYIVAKAGIKLHCYIGYYIVVVPKAQAQEKFQFVCALLHELGLPLNCDKLTPPPPPLDASLPWVLI